MITDDQIREQNQRLNDSVDQLGASALEWKARAEAAEALVARQQADLTRLAPIEASHAWQKAAIQTFLKKWRRRDNDFMDDFDEEISALEASIAERVTVLTGESAESALAAAQQLKDEAGE